MKTTNNSWKSDLAQNIRSVKDFNSFFGESLPKDFSYEINIPLHIAKAIKETGSQVLSNQFMPKRDELYNQDKGLEDPIGDQLNSTENGIVHRYKNRILFFPTSTCPVICRYCFRKNELSNKAEVLKGRLNSLETFLQNNLDVNEVILSGGDPLILDDGKILDIISLLKRYSQIKFLRFHTRTPISLPQRITERLINTLKENQEDLQIIVAVHINHPEEITTEVRKALEKLKVFKLLSQTVLLKNVNDSARTLKSLIYELNKYNIRPYYLHHPDKVKGGMHFMVSKERGRSIMSALRKEIPGWLLPHYIEDHSTGKQVIS